MLARSNRDYRLLTWSGNAGNYRYQATLPGLAEALRFLRDKLDCANNDPLVKPEDCRIVLINQDGTDGREVPRDLYSDGEVYLTPEQAHANEATWQPYSEYHEVYPLRDPYVMRVWGDPGRGETVFYRLSLAEAGVRFSITGWVYPPSEIEIEGAISAYEEIASRPALGPASTSHSALLEGN